MGKEFLETTISLEHGDTSEVCTALDERPDKTRLHRVLIASMPKEVPVRNSAGKDLGKIEQITIDIHSGRIAYAVLSFDGLLGVACKMFAVPWKALHLDEKAIIQTFILDVDRKTLENAPGFDKDKWPRKADPVFKNTEIRH